MRDGVTLHPSHFNPRVCDAPERVKKDYAGVTNLSSNEFVYDGLADVVAEWAKTIEPERIARYPYYRRTELAVAAFFGIDGGNVLLCPGADEAIRMLTIAMGANGRLIVSWPNYDSYEAYAGMAGLQIVRVRLDKGQTLSCHRLDMRRTLLATGPALVAVANPHAITGEALADADHQALVQDCAEAGHALILDECYGGFEPGGRRPPPIHPNVVVLRSFSKRFGMAGMRVAALVASTGVIRRLRPWRSANPMSALSLSFVEHMLANHDVLDRAADALAATRDWFCGGLRDAGLRHWASAANFVLVDFESADRARRAAEALASRHIVVRAFPADHAFASCLRVTIANRQIMKAVIDAFVAA